MIKPKDFASDTPPPRIIGSECEYNVQFGSVQNDDETSDDYHNRINEMLSDFTRTNNGTRANLTHFQDNSSNYFLLNGGKLYNDMGHAEYASPEALGPEQAMLADFAGIVVMNALANIAKITEQPVSGIYRRSGYAVTGNNRSTTTGYHENYLVPRILFVHPNHAHQILRSHLATRHIWGGGGFWHHGKYSTNQKMVGTGNAQGDTITTEGSKPLYKIASAASSEAWARLEVRCADPLQSPTLRYLGFAATSLTLRLLEHDFEQWPLRQASFKHPISMLKSSSVDPRYSQRSRDAAQRTALDFQYQLLESVVRLSELIELPLDEQRAIPLWEEKLDAVERHIKYGDDSAKLDIEWIAKEYFINRATLKDGRDERAIEVDMLWDRVDVDGIGALWWQKISAADREYFNKVPDYVRQPPRGTRAGARSAFIKAHADHSSLLRIDWGHVVCEELGEKIYTNLSDPYDENAA